MSFLDFLFGRRPVASTAGIAKERLQIVLAHERAGRDAPTFLPALKRDLLAAVGKYVTINEDLLRVTFSHEEGEARLEINVSFDPAAPPSAAQTRRVRPTGRFATPAKATGGGT